MIKAVFVCISFLVLSKAAFSFEPMRIEVRGHYSENYYELKKEMGEWVCDSNSIQGYPLKQKQKLDYSWKKILAESKRQSPKSCEKPMSIKRYLGAKSLSVITCATQSEAAKLLGQVKKLCKPI